MHCPWARPTRTQCLAIQRLTLQMGSFVSDRKKYFLLGLWLVYTGSDWSRVVVSLDSKAIIVCLPWLAKNDLIDDAILCNDQPWSFRRRCLEQNLIFKIITAVGGLLGRNMPLPVLMRRFVAALLTPGAVLYLTNSLIHKLLFVSGNYSLFTWDWKR